MTIMEGDVYSSGFVVVLAGSDLQSVSSVPDLDP